jgi:hypothetical protein
LIGWHGGQPYDTRRGVGHHADRQYVKSLMVMVFAVRTNLPWYPARSISISISISVPKNLGGLIERTKQASG